MCAHTLLLPWLLSGLPWLALGAACYLYGRRSGRNAAQQKHDEFVAELGNLDARRAAYEKLYGPESLGV